MMTASNGSIRSSKLQDQADRIVETLRKQLGEIESRPQYSVQDLNKNFQSMGARKPEAADGQMRLNFALRSRSM